MGENYSNASITNLKLDLKIVKTEGIEDYADDCSTYRREFEETSLLKRVLTENLQKPIRSEISLPPQPPIKYELDFDTSLPPTFDCNLSDLSPEDDVFDNQIIPDDIFEDACGLMNDIERFQPSPNPQIVLKSSDHTYCATESDISYTKIRNNSSTGSLLQQMLTCPQGNEEDLATTHNYKSLPTPSPSENDEYFEPFLKSAMDISDLPDSPISVDSSDEERYLNAVWTHMKVVRQPTSKWFISREDFHGDFFPTYCSGSAYIFGGRHVIDKLAEASLRVGFFWIDDFYVTGLLAKSAQIGHVKLNDGYVLTPSTFVNRFRDFEKRKFLLFGHVQNVNEMKDVWKIVYDERYRWTA